jgi:transposase
MPHPLLKAVRGRCVRHVEAGHSCHEAARKHDVSPSFVINLMTLRRKTGGVEPRPRGGYRHSKLNEHRAYIVAQVERQSDITMPDLAAVLAQAKRVEVAPSTLSRFLIASGFSFKKTLRASEQDRLDVAKARAEWIEGLRSDGPAAPFVIAEPMNREIFEAWVEQMLAPSLRPGDVGILDNLSSHKSPVAEAAIRATGTWLLFLPPYSPDLNPIEMASSKLKAHLKATAARIIDALERVIGDICKLFTPQECSAYFKAAGHGFS